MNSNSLFNLDENCDTLYTPPKKIPKLSDSGCIESNIHNNSTSNSQTAIENVKRKICNPGFAQKYMSKHGHKEGRGLGKNQDGIVEPLEASKQKGKRGLGFKSIGLENACLKFDPTQEKILVDEEIFWLNNNYKEPLSKEILLSWVKTGPPKKSIDDTSPFCDSSILKLILSSKNVLSDISESDLKNGRSRANPFEAIHKAIFLNRAAMKMANLDSILGWMFTEPKDLNGKEIIGREDLLYFADVCAGPGGFSEYVFFRKKWRAKGFGFTLKNDNDFLLNEFCAGPSETFEPHYGSEGNGDIFVPKNIESFKNHVLKYTNGKGVHFMMADGGVHIDENFNDQELICKKLYLCQCLLALFIVRTNGHFVVKLFDLFTSFSVGLIYLMFRSFHAISIIKPNTSRPANSERYLVCKFKKEDCGAIADHLFEINKKVPRFEEKVNLDILEIVPVDFIKEETQFYDYITSSNEGIGKNQIVSLTKLAAFCEDADAKEEKQQELRKICLEKWKVPDEARAEPKKFDAKEKCQELLGTFPPFEYDICTNEKIPTLFQLFKERAVAVRDWHFVILNKKDDISSCALYLGLGRNNINEYTNRGWKKLSNYANGLCFPTNTLIYGEIVEELIGEGKSQIKRFAFHIIDGLFLGGEDIRSFSLLERWKLCELFAKALYKESYPIRMKNYFELKDLNELPRTLTTKLNKSSSSKSLCFPIESKCSYKAGGILLFRDTNGNWHRHLSNKHKVMYLYNSKTKETVFESNIFDEKQKYDIFATFEQSFRNRMIWWWDEKAFFTISGSPNLFEKQHQDLCECIAEKLVVFN